MRDLKVPESGPKRNLLDATERLVVEKGFDLVSVRDITGAIKANVAAVNYHFGSREGLMDLVMSHAMDAVDEARVEALEAGKKDGVEGIFSAYVNSVLTAAGRVEMDLAFFLKLSGRVMVFPAALLSPALADGRKQVKELYLKALAGAVPQISTADLEAAWAFFEAGLGQSLVNLRSDLAPSVQAKHWIRFGVSALGLSGISQQADKPVHADLTEIPEKTEPPEAVIVPETVEISKPAKAPKAKSKKGDDQSMMFDF